MRDSFKLACVLASIVLVGCGDSEQTRTNETPAAATDTANNGAVTIEDAITDKDRLIGDKEEDDWRKPAEVLKFLGVRPGMRVLDYFAAGGYYTELLSHVVGAQGQVVAYNNPAYLKFAASKPSQRYGENRLPNVAQLTTPPEELPLEPNSLDAALFVMSYHDLYWRPEDGSWTPTDPKQALAKLVPALKPGATVVVVDHVANAGSDIEHTVDTLHRIDPAIVRRDFEAAGLAFDAASDIFKHPEDDHTKPVFDPAVRHKTDQLVYRFKKK